MRMDKFNNNPYDFSTNICILSCPGQVSHRRVPRQSPEKQKGGLGRNALFTRLINKISVFAKDRKEG